MTNNTELNKLIKIMLEGVDYDGLINEIENEVDDRYLQELKWIWQETEEKLKDFQNKINNTPNN